MPVRYSKHSAGPDTRRSQYGDYWPDYGSWTRDSLALELEQRGLSKKGNKSQMIARLREDDSG